MSSATYRVIAAGSSHEITVQRSRFLCTLERVHSENDARNVINQIRQTHWEAAHHSSAFIIGPDGALRHANDDGEPAGTAGPPILEVLKGAEVSDVVCVVSRWFGGTLLGTGGLARAYADAARQTLAKTTIVERSLQQVCQVELDILDVGRVEHALRGRGAHVLGVDYHSSAILNFVVHSALLVMAIELVAQMTSGAGDLKVLGSEWVDHS